jgi:hypothetical protein
MLCEQGEFGMGAGTGQSDVVLKLNLVIQIAKAFKSDDSSVAEKLSEVSDLFSRQ